MSLDTFPNLWEELDKATTACEILTPSQRAWCIKWHESTRAPEYSLVLRDYTTLPPDLIHLISQYAAHETKIHTTVNRINRLNGRKGRVVYREYTYTTLTTLLYGVPHGPHMTYQSWVLLKRFSPVRWFPFGPVNGPFLSVLGCHRNGFTIGLEKNSLRYEVHYQGITIYESSGGWHLQGDCPDPSSHEFLTLFNVVPKGEIPS